MQICLINPQRLLELNVPTLKSTPPLGLAYIAASLKAEGHEVFVIDAIAENPKNIFPFDERISVNGLNLEDLISRIPLQTDVIGFTFMFSNNWLLYRKMTDMIGEAFPSAKIIAGGEHISAMPEFCINQTKYLDVCIVGEGEDTIVELISAFEMRLPIQSVEGIAFRDKAGGVIVNERRKRIRSISELPMPAWELFPLDKYDKFKMAYGVQRGKSLPITATRGCPYECTFCSSPLMWTTKYSMREPKEVIKEISFLYHNFGIRNFDFYDLTAIIRKKWIIEFCKEIETSGLEFSWQIPAGTRSEAIDFEVATWLYKSGCRNITYAPESGSKDILKSIKKKVNIDSILESIGYSYKAGLNIKLNMIIGFPQDTHKSIWQSLWFLIKASWAGAHDTIPAIFSPYPGSMLFDDLVATGEVDIYNDNYFRDLVFYDSFTTNRIFNHNISPRMIRFYQILITLTFYFFNYLFRPLRFFKTIQNLVTQNAESRAEDTILDFLKNLKVFKQRKIVSNQL